MVAEVVKHVVLHVKGSFAGGLGKVLTYVEIGNEPDLPVTLFWTGRRARFLSLYKACAATLDARFGSSIRIGAGSFAWVPGGLGLLRAGPARPKPAAHVFQVFERLSETPALMVGPPSRPRARR